MRDIAWPGPQAPARLIPGQDPNPGSDVVHTLSALPRWFTRVRLLGTRRLRSAVAGQVSLGVAAEGGHEGVAVAGAGDHDDVGRLAERTGYPVLCTGDDFAATDISVLRPPATNG